MADLRDDSAGHVARPKTTTRWLWFGLVAAAIAVGVAAAQSQDPGGDLHVFWHAGREFASGAALYDAEEGLRPYLYPPFAAFAFQLIAWLPFSIAAGLSAAANVFLWALAVVLVRRICRDCDGTNVTTWSTVAAVALSARYFRSNTSLIQINALVLCLALGGIAAFQSDRRGRCAAFLCAAAWLKVTPALIVLWAILRGGRRMAASVALFGAAFLALPLLQRGVSTGVNDLVQFRSQLSANVIAVSDASPYAAQNLRTVAHALLGGTSEAALARSDRWADAAALGLVVLMILAVARRARRSLGVSALELTLPILIAHLLPGKTGKHHLVTFLLVFQAQFSVRRVGLARWQLAVLYVGWGLAAIAALGGRSLVGRDLHAWMGDIGFLAWCMLYWFVAAVLLMEKDGSPAAAAARTHGPRP